MDASLPEITLKKFDKVALGLLVGGLLAVGAGMLWGLYLLLPVLIALAENTLIFVAELAALFFAFIVAVELFLARDAVLYKLKVVARNLRKAVVREDPIGVLDVAIHRFEQKLEEIDTSLASAAAAKDRLRNRIKVAVGSAESEESLTRAAQAKSRSQAEINQHAVASGRWRDAAARLQPMLDNLNTMQASLERARDLACATLEDRKNQKVVMATELDAMQESQKSVKAFKRFFSSGADLDMMSLSVDEIERQSTEAEAEIDQFLRAINPQLEAADLKKSAEADAAIAKLNAFADKQKLPAPPVKDGVVVERQKSLTH